MTMGSMPGNGNGDGQPPSDTDTTGVSPETPSRAELFEVLQNDRRRAVLECLCAHDGASDLTDLAVWIAAEEHNIDPETVSDRQRKSVYVSLYQNHLPRLGEAELVERDRDSGTVALGECADEALALLSERDADSAPSGYLSTALAVAAVGLVGVLGLGPAALLAARIWAIAALTALVALVSVELYRQVAAPRRR